MAILTKSAGEADHVIHAAFFTCGGQWCFLCGELVDKVAIYWMGNAAKEKDLGEIIYFHPHCALSFCRRLLQDAEKFYDKREHPYGT